MTTDSRKPRDIRERLFEFACEIVRASQFLHTREQYVLVVQRRQHHVLLRRQRDDRFAPQGGSAERRILDRAEPSAFAPGEDLALLTVHRPGNVDDAAALGAILEAAAALARELTVVLPAHPRTRARIAEFGFGRFLRSLDEPRLTAPGRILLTEPLGTSISSDLHFASARLVLTDSGGLQEVDNGARRAVRDAAGETERPVTVTGGTSVLVGADGARIAVAAGAALAASGSGRRIPPLWDGHAAERIVKHLLEVI